MSITRQTRVFKSGNSWAVRLPAGFRFNSDIVYITRDDSTGTIMISERPISPAWDAFFKLRDETVVPADFLKERPLNSTGNSDGIFDDWKE
ncbi:AbrB family transcriptional regulator [Bordetella sputigena]|uniref:antitoxin n=1 Tax=Bordetella sputigena TaxID=1416810 RepID=UPI0039F0219C